MKRIITFPSLIFIFHLLILTTKVESFEPLIKLPKLHLLRGTRVVSVHDFGAKGDGFTNDTELPKLHRLRGIRVVSVHDFGAKGDGFTNDTELPKLHRLRGTIVVSVHDFGAKGDGFTNDTEAFKSAWEKACSSQSRSRIEIPSGSTYLVGPLDFAGPCRSKVTLRVSGAIVAPKDPSVWHGLNPRKWLYFHEVKHLTLEGGGVINGMGEGWWSRSCKVNRTNPCGHAPTVLTFHKCEDLKVSNLMTVDSQQMHMAFTNCVHVKVSHLRVIAPADSPNTDGIHISASSRVQVSNIRINTGDDCISIVGNSSQIQIKNITCKAGHGISIGSLGQTNSWEQVTDVSVKGALLANTENGVRIKSWQGGSGYAQRISFRNVLMENVSNPIIIDQYYCDSFKLCLNQTSAVKVDNISFVNIKGTSATEEAIRIACSDYSPCENIYLHDIELLPHSGGITTSFCWNAIGSSLGHVYPPSCLSHTKCHIQQKVLPSHTHSSF